MQAARVYLRVDLLLNLGISLTFTSYIPYLRTLGLSPSDVSLVNFGFWAIILFCEIPTGLFADRCGRAKSVQVGVLIQAICALLYGTASGFWTALIYELGVGIGASFISGAQSAWLREALQHEGCDQAVYASTVAKTAQWRAAVSLFGGLLGGALSLVHLRAVWVVAGICIGIAGGVALYAMKDAPRQHTPQAISFIAPLRQSWQRLREHRELQWLLFSFLAYSFVLPFNHYWAPYFRTRFGEVPQTLLWAPMYLSLGIGAWLAKQAVRTNAGPMAALCLALGCAGAGLGLIDRVPTALLPLFFLALHELGRGAFLPILEVATHQRIENAYRATYASMQSLLARTGNLLVLGGVWAYTADAPWSNGLIGTVWAFCGGALALSALLLWITIPRSHASS